MSGSTTACPNPSESNKRWPWAGYAVRLGCQYILALVFLMAAVSKITDLRGFSDKLVVTSGLPEKVAEHVAAFLPWLELTCGACLLLGRAVREAAALLTHLLLVFLVYSLAHWGDSDCGCLVFPSIGINKSPWWPVVQDLLLFLCGLRVLKG